jgi:WD repeat-containing protein 19
MLIHSFTLAKRLVKINDHLGAARMLMRVATNIS